MSKPIINPKRKTCEYMPSVYGNKPEMRAYDLDDVVSVNMKDLFPCLPDPIYVDDNDDVSVFETLTRKALENIDMSDITPETSVNICCSEHGFVICGGKPYAQMIKTIRDVVKERTGCIDIRLRVVMWRTPREGWEAVEYYNLLEEFDNNVATVSAYDKAVPIETRIGTFYGLEKAYDADKFIYAYYDDPREIYCHKMYRKSFKAFTMNMARYETRSVFHNNMGNATVNANTQAIIPQSIFDSDFVQSKYTFSCFLHSSPAGLDSIDADKDLYALDDRSLARSLKYYAMPYHLFRSLEDFNIIIDGGRWVWYMHGGGLIDGTVVEGYKDFMDIDCNPAPPRGNFCSPGLRSIIVNQCWYGIPFPASLFVPLYLVGDELNEMWAYDPLNCMCSQFTKPANTLPEAVEMSKQVSGNDKFLIFDGSFGFVNCSKSIAEELFAKAPEIQEKVLSEYYPKYMKQRGIEIKD